MSPLQVQSSIVDAVKDILYKGTLARRPRSNRHRQIDEADISTPVAVDQRATNCLKEVVRSFTAALHEYIVLCVKSSQEWANINYIMYIIKIVFYWFKILYVHYLMLYLLYFILPIHSHYIQILQPITLK